MPGSTTTLGRRGACDDAPRRVAFRHSDDVGTQDMEAIVAQWLACTLPYRRFTDVLANARARLGADVDRYSFIVMDLHHLLLCRSPGAPLSDRFGRRPVYLGGVIAAIVWAFCFFMLMNTSQPALIVLAVIVGLVIHAVMYGPQAAFVTEQFPTRVRYAGSSLAYTLAGILGGGFAPLIIVALFRASHGTTAVSLYVSGALIVTAIALIAARETARRPLED